jgi:non-ribosomal peptide synthetase component F/thioesterase domain-containing protein
MKPLAAYDATHDSAKDMDDESALHPAGLDFSSNGSVDAASADSSVQDEGVFVFPASLEQIRYWTLDQLDGNSTASNMAIAARLEGEVSDSVVEQSIRSIVERHEALRTTFQVIDGTLCQVISEEARYNFAVTDLRSLAVADRATAAEAAVEEHSHARANLATGPAFFVRLIHVTDKQHILAFTMHHIVCDGWSNGILIRDFTDFYTAHIQHREPALAELPFQFADFTVWQQNWLESEAAEAALAYWRKHIHRQMPAVDLPTDRPRLPQKSYPGHIESTLLSTELTGRLKGYCRTHGATMHQVLLAAFEALIARYASQSEFLLGSTIANRTQPGMENVVGRFANPQVILADVTGDPTYKELLRRVLEWSTESYAHQDLPFSRLMEEFQLDQAGATSQFLQVYFVYQKAFMQPHEAPGVKVIPRPSVSGGVNFDLLVSIVERAEGPRLQMEYNTVLFKPERIRSLIEMYVRVLNAVMEDDSVVVSRLPLVSVQDETALTFKESVSESQTPAKSLAEWIDRLAESQGEALAIVDGSQRISWNALLERSLTMAVALESLGVSAGQTVILRMDRGWNEAAASLALLRLGAMILPLPASASPVQWSRLIATHQPILALASAAFAASLLEITSYEQLLAHEPASVDLATSNAASYPSPSSTAWLGLKASVDGLYETIPCAHNLTLQHLLSTASALDIRHGDTVLITPAESATDAWVDLMLPLVSGATLFYPGQNQSSMAALIEQNQISFVFTSPSNLLAAIHHRWAGDRRLNMVVRGAVLTSAQLQRLSVTPLRLWSLISSALTAGPLAIAKVSVLSGETQHRFASLAGERLMILDDNGQPVPVGVSGELAVGNGDQITRTGYLATVVNTITSNSASIIPLSGAWNASIEVFDTVQRLVRLHGYRLRLGELEDVLWQSTAVAETVAAILPVEGVDTLVAYFRTFDPTQEAARSVRMHFQSVAPGLVAGAELISVDSIPRRPDGSADFALLPPPGTSKPSDASSEEYIGPRDDLESSLVAIWEEVLGIRPIGIRNSFFELGGYSLMIVRLFARINKVLGTSLPITTIFNAPTVESLADIVRGRAYYSSLVPVQTSGDKPPFFMIHSYLLYSGIPRVIGADTPFYGLRELDTDAQDMTVEQRAAAYLDAMRSVQPRGPYYIGGWCAAGPLAVETARQIIASGEDVGFLVLFDSWRPGYSAELAKEQAGSQEMSLSARLGRKYRFHRNRLENLSINNKVNYIFSAIGNKSASVRNRVYLRNWAIAEYFCKRFGLSLPHFMHNVSLTTLNSLKEYRGVEPYAGTLTLIRAQEAPYFPGAKEHCGWDSIVTGGVKVLWAPGDHESMFLDPHLQKVGEQLRESLNEAYAEQLS